MSNVLCHAENIKRNVKYLLSMLNYGEDRDSRLIDVAYQIEDLAERIINEEKDNADET